MRYPRDIGDTRRKPSTKVGLLKTGETLPSLRNTQGRFYWSASSAQIFVVYSVYSLTCNWGTPVKAA